MSNKKSIFEYEYKYEENNLKSANDQEISKNVANYGKIK